MSLVNRASASKRVRRSAASPAVNQRNTLIAEPEAGQKIGRIEKAAISSGNAVCVIEGRLPQLSIARRRNHRRHLVIRLDTRHSRHHSRSG
jgi:hypothetical protein